ncbi:MAG: hypothetical protein QF473_12320 [Planctomycetota bacterium]|nr:hypothetical protein [Planctomycetota bacterium]
MHATAELLKDDIVFDDFGRLFVLRIDAVTVPAIGSAPAVVVDQTPINLATRAGGPEAESLTQIMDE